MSIVGFDHAAMPTADPEALIAYYQRLGFGLDGVQAWRDGKVRAFAITFGNNKINVHPSAVWQDPAFTLRGPGAVPGCGDFCFVWDGTLGALSDALAKGGAAVIEGPVGRVGGRAAGTARGTSLYTRDPDGNLLEFIVY